MLEIELEILVIKFEDDPSLSLWRNLQNLKIEVRAQKIGPRPKIKILMERSGFRSLRGTTCQISWSYEFKPQKIEWRNTYTNK